MSKQQSKKAVPSLGKQLLTSLFPKVNKPNAAPMLRSSKAVAAPLTAVAKPTQPIIDLTSDEETNAAPKLRSSKAAVSKPTPPLIQPAVSKPTPPIIQPAVSKLTQPANELTLLTTDEDCLVDCWRCDVCKVNCFLDFDEACAHEKNCNGNDIDDDEFIDGQTTGGFTIEYDDGQTVGNLNGKLVDGQTTGQLVAVAAVPHHSTSSKRKHDDDSLALVQFAGKRI